MSFWSTARRQAIFLTRAFSSAQNAVRAPNSTPSLTLSPEKMRALIAMYHQTETFVTRGNLEDKINEAFTGKPGEVATDRATLTLEELKGQQRQRENVPTVTEWSEQQSFAPTTQNSTNDYSLWSSKNQVRDLKVIEALYGVETLGAADRALPGLETLDDHANMIQTSDEEDREYEDSDY
ncbi:hypothetical protein DFH09DRAFT_1130685 [Mycena vulgaris]|nr:hypothetical protein DFH09DRAFT_1130685 [Mycena vulgaris]